VGSDISIDPTEHADLHWYANGQSAVSGSLLELSRRLDALFVRSACEWGAREYAVPPFVPARELAKIDYFHSFPQLVTFPVALDADPDNLRRYGGAAALDESGAVPLFESAPIRDVLTPAACYHFYILFQGATLDGPRFLTTRATCYRRESHYLPLERQWSFSMREIVCIGTEEEVASFLKTSRERLSGFFQRVGLPVDWQDATDPFFDPSRNPRYVFQKVEPVKREMVYQGRLAIGSTNCHKDTFGQAFAIRRDGREAFSGCVAFGVERWIYAFLDHYGMNESDWPDLDAEAIE